MKRFLILLAWVVFTPLTALAAAVQISEVPTNWRIENYPASTSGVTIWYSSSPCASGTLTLPSGATSADMNRLWSLILAAKLSGHKIFVYYENSSSPASCPILSFGMDG